MTEGQSAGQTGYKTFENNITGQKCEYGGVRNAQQQNLTYSYE